MKVLLLFFAISLLIFQPLFGQLTHVSGKPEGFVTLNGGVKGGEGGPVVVVKTTDDLLANLDKTTPVILLIEGTITITSEISCRGDKTIVGLGTTACIRGGGLAWNTKKNVIVQNITFEGSGDDMLKINNKCENFWIDHCTIRDSETGLSPDVDGGLDITRASKNITVSYCHFYNHDKNMLIGHSDSNIEDTSITVTIHHCFFDGTIQRNPRVRFATVHCYNNYYLGNSIYGVASACNARVFVENCYFKNVASPTIVGVPGFSPAGYLLEKGSVFDNCGTPQTKAFDIDFTSFYPYTADTASVIPNLVSTVAGSGKLSNRARELKSSENNRLFLDHNRISFVASTTSPVEIILFDSSGKKIMVPFNDRVKSGVENHIRLSTLNLKKGIYIARMNLPSQNLCLSFRIK